MKQTIALKLFTLASASALIFSSCTKEASGSHDMDNMGAMNKRSSQSMNLKKDYHADLHALNNSGVMGKATLMLNGTKLTVKIDATGLEAGKPHPQHIHGFTENNRNSTCPNMSADTDGDGIISLAESVPSYGPILLDLSPMPTADANGEVHYTRTFDVGVGLVPLQNRAIVLHGLTVNGTYVATLPVACGQVR